MKTRTIATLTALALSAFAGAPARADDSAVALEWQRPGYVMDVIVVTAPRPTAVTNGTDAAEAAAGSVELAREAPGYVEEVVVVTANRTEVLAEFREAARQAALARPAPLLLRGNWKNWAGMPVR